MIAKSIRFIRAACYALAGVLLFGAGMAAGYIAAPKERGSDAETQHTEDDALAQTDDTLPVDAAEPAAGINTFAVFRYEFGCCEHTLEVPTEEMIGMDAADAQKAFPLKHIVEFSQERAVLTELLDGCCPKHYFVRAQNGVVTVTQRNADTLEQRTVAEFPSPETLDGQADELRSGLVFNSLEDINVYFESYDS